jgi:hypothetical protein
VVDNTQRPVGEDLFHNSGVQTVEMIDGHWTHGIFATTSDQFMVNNGRKERIGGRHSRGDVRVLCNFLAHNHDSGRLSLVLLRP